MSLIIELFCYLYQKLYLDGYFSNLFQDLLCLLFRCNRDLDEDSLSVASTLFREHGKHLQVMPPDASNVFVFINVICGRSATI